MSSTAAFDETPAGEPRPQREVAQRLFAGEFNASRHTFKESGDRSPSFVVSPFGAKVNRLFVVGVLTNVESFGQTPGNYKAQVVDPTGTFYMLSGQFEPEATAQLADLKPPCIVAVVGKARLRDNEGTTYVNVRPERIHVLTKGERDAWVAETAKLSLLRLDAMREATKLATVTPQAIEGLGFPKEIAEGVAKAFEHYGKPDLAKHASTIRDALESLLPGGASERIHAEPSFATAAPPAPAQAPARASAPPVATKAPPAENPHETLVAALVEKLDDTKGAPWEDVVAEAAKKGVKESEVEECLNALMDKGTIYEPVLGRLKSTK